MIEPIGQGPAAGERGVHLLRGDGGRPMVVDHQDARVGGGGRYVPGGRPLQPRDLQDQVILVLGDHHAVVLRGVQEVVRVFGGLHAEPTCGDYDVVEPAQVVGQRAGDVLVEVQLGHVGLGRVPGNPAV